MRQELDNFIIESDKDLPYFQEIVRHIEKNATDIFNFFNLEQLPFKVRILLISYEPFKEWIISKYGEILGYVAGDSDSKTHTIRILNIEDQIKYTTHKDASIERIKSTALHEIVHQCHHVYHRDCYQINWFAEGLATNLAHHKNIIVDLNECDFEKLKNDFSHYSGNYNYAYTIVNYVLNNYPKEEVDKLYSDPDYLRANADRLFNEAKEYISKQTKTLT